MKKIMIPAALGAVIGAGLGAKHHKESRTGGALKGGGFGLLAGTGAGVTGKYIKEILNNIKASKAAPDIVEKMKTTKFKLLPEPQGFRDLKGRPDSRWKPSQSKTENVLYGSRDSAPREHRFDPDENLAYRTERYHRLKAKYEKLNPKRNHKELRKLESEHVSRFGNRPTVQYDQRKRPSFTPKAQQNHSQKPHSQMTMQEHIEAIKRKRGFRKQGSLEKTAIPFALPLIGAGLGAAAGAITAPKGQRMSGALMGGAFGALSGGVGGGLWNAGKAAVGGGGRAAMGKAFSSGLGKATMGSTIKGVGVDTALTTGLNAMTGAYKPQGQGQPGYTGQFAAPSMPMMKAGGISEEDLRWAGNQDGSYVSERDLKSDNNNSSKRNNLKRLGMTAGTLGLAGIGRRVAMDASNHRGVGLAGLLAGASIIPAAYAINKKVNHATS